VSKLPELLILATSTRLDDRPGPRGLDRMADVPGRLTGGKASCVDTNGLV